MTLDLVEITEEEFDNLRHNKSSYLRSTGLYDVFNDNIIAFAHIENGVWSYWKVVEK